MSRPIRLTRGNVEKITNGYEGRILHDFNLSPSSMTFYFSQSDELKFHFEPDSLKAVVYGRYERNNRNANEQKIYTLEGKDPAEILPRGVRGTRYDGIEKVPLDKNEIGKVMKELPLSGLYPTFHSEEWINADFISYSVPRVDKLIAFDFRFDTNSLIGADYRNSDNAKRFIKYKVFEVKRKGETIYLVTSSRKKIEDTIPDEMRGEFSIRSVNSIGGLGVSRITPPRITLYCPQYINEFDLCQLGNSKDE
jgi:hypothetical protein